MAKSILIANWKNYPASLPEVRTILNGLVRSKAIYKKVSLFIAPPAPYLSLVGERVRGWGELGVQNISSEERGTHSGEVTPEILKSLGVRLAILGHSEQRALGESAESVAKKVRLALKSGFTPVICFGEKERDKDGEHFEVMRHELKTLLSEVKKAEASKIVLAYERIWAIGNKASGPIEPTELSQTVIYIKKILSDLFGRKIADQIPVIYGGSVDDTNAGLLVRNSGIRGFLVGRASLDYKKFEGIANSVLGK